MCHRIKRNSPGSGTSWTSNNRAQRLVKFVRTRRRRPGVGAKSAIYDCTVYSLGWVRRPAVVSGRGEVPQRAARARVELHGRRDGRPTSQTSPQVHRHPHRSTAERTRYQRRRLPVCIEYRITRLRRRFYVGSRGMPLPTEIGLATRLPPDPDKMQLFFPATVSRYDRPVCCYCCCTPLRSGHCVREGTQTGSCRSDGGRQWRSHHGGRVPMRPTTSHVVNLVGVCVPLILGAPYSVYSMIRPQNSISISTPLTVNQGRSPL